MQQSQLAPMKARSRIQQAEPTPRETFSFSLFLLDILVMLHKIRHLLLVVLLVLWLAAGASFLIAAVQHMSVLPSEEQAHPFNWLPMWEFAALTIILIPLLNSTSRNKKFGSARWASLVELRRYNFIAPEHPTRSYLPLGKKYGFHVGLDPQRQQNHVLLIAPTGAGKTSEIIIPGLLSEQGERSLFVHDIKGELITVCLGALSERFDCKIFAPMRPQQSHSYNPLMHVHTDDQADQLALCIVQNTGSSTEPFWNNVARLLLRAVILHLRAAEPYAPLARLADIFTMPQQDIQTLLLESPSPTARRAATAFLNNLEKNPKLVGSVFSEMNSRLIWLENSSVRQTTAMNDIDFDALIHGPVVLFLSIPASMTTLLKPLSATFTMQLMNFLAAEAEQAGGRLPRPVALYLDEFNNAGYIPNYTTYISTIRSMGLSLIMASQDFGRIRDIYGENGFDTIRSNARTQILFSGAGPEETHHYSLMLGQKTITTYTRNVTPAVLPPFRNLTVSSGAAPRLLMHPDELRTMPRGTLVVISENLHPFKVKARPYYQQPALQARVNLPSPPLVRIKPVTPTPPPELATPTAPQEEQAKQQTTEPEDHFFMPE